MIIKPVRIEQLKELFVKVLFSRTDKISKVSDGSINNGLAYGVSKLAQKALKDIALSQAHYYPDAASGDILDNMAEIYGISARFGVLGSSTYLRVVGDAGTSYMAGTHIFSGSNGISWILESDFTIPTVGFTYVKVSSNITGAETQVDPLTINKVNPIPAGHNYVINEYKALGGRDAESDDDFRNRIKSAINGLSRDTLSYLLQVMLKFNTNILRLFNYGSDGLGKNRIGIATVNGADLSPIQLTTLNGQIDAWLCLNEKSIDGLAGNGVQLLNIYWQPIDISFRVQMRAGFNPDEERKEIQIQMNKYLDYRTWIPGQRVEWDNLLEIAKSSEGIEYVPDEFFYPQQDLVSDFSKLPRVRGFQMLDMNGSIISDGQLNLNPIYYPTKVDFSFISTVLAEL